MYGAVGKAFPLPAILRLGWTEISGSGKGGGGGGVSLKNELFDVTRIKSKHINCDRLFCLPVCL